jgi:hypothetical protein
MNRIGLMTMAVVLVASWSFAQEKQGWEVHDMKRPQPTVITPGTASTQEKAGMAPSDAVVLFDGKDLSQWQTDSGEAAKWNVVDETIEVAPKTGTMRTKKEFGDIQLHIEWMEPEGVEGKDQHRGNSGVFLQGLYEVQVLDNYKSETYPDGTAGGLYGQYPPQVNACRPPGQWQCYDIIFHPAKVEGGKVTKPATATVLFNGVLVQDNSAILGPTQHGVLTSYPDGMAEKGPVALQDHGFKVRFRNVWLRELKEKPEAASKNPTAPEK